MDADGDKITLSSDEDFQCMMETELNADAAKKTLKIFVELKAGSKQNIDEKPVAVEEKKAVEYDSILEKEDVVVGN
jgi:hypothetical protein